MTMHVKDFERPKNYSENMNQKLEELQQTEEKVIERNDSDHDII